MNPKDLVGVHKVCFSAVPANVLAEVAVGMYEGALKYGRHNYRETPVQASVYYDAALRHLTSWWEGENLDPDSGIGLNHVSKAITTLVVLRDAMLQNKLKDDRPPGVDQFMERVNAMTEKLNEQYQEPKPKHTRL